jgi:ubiquinone/menaquinone biosynthesis C-methylase UbiE
LPFPDAGFDYVLSWNVIHHGTLGDLGRRLGEIWRVLRPAGLLQATVLSTRDANYGIGHAIAPDTCFFNGFCLRSDRSISHADRDFDRKVTRLRYRVAMKVNRA